jgi:hypothetical protein
MRIFSTSRDFNVWVLGHCSMASELGIDKVSDGV